MQKRPEISGLLHLHRPLPGLTNTEGWLHQFGAGGLSQLLAAWCHAAGGRSIGKGTLPSLLAPSAVPKALASLWLGAFGSMETALGFNHSVGRFAGQMAPAGSTWVDLLLLSPLPSTVPWRALLGTVLVDSQQWLCSNRQLCLGIAVARYSSQVAAMAQRLGSLVGCIFAKPLLSLAAWVVARYIGDGGQPKLN